jgi:riboflavin synthase
MFTGIIETMGLVLHLEHEGSNMRLLVQSSLAPELKVDQSLAHNGVCLTVVKVQEQIHEVVMVQETLARSTMKDIQIGDWINLERCMPANGRFDGHIVQGHVDSIATLKHVEDLNGSFRLDFHSDSKEANELMVSKGSICINGISLTLASVEAGDFSVAIIPYTWENTNLRDLKIGAQVNIEWDVLGKYIRNILHSRGL